MAPADLFVPTRNKSSSVNIFLDGIWSVLVKDKIMKILTPYNETYIIIIIINQYISKVWSFATQFYYLTPTKNKTYSFN